MRLSSSSIFREYDIRGVAGDSFDQKIVKEYEAMYGPFPGITLTLDDAHHIGQAYGTLIAREGGTTVAVGYEERPYGKDLAQAFTRGVVSTGVEVLDLGTAFTPLVYFSVARESLDGGVMVTGSHNIWFYNGFKLMKKNVDPIFGKELARLRAMIEEGDLYKASSSASIRPHDEWTAYKKYLAHTITLRRPLKIVVDCGNGSMGRFAPEALRAIGCEVVELYTNVDPSFPHHAPDPENPANMKDLGVAVLREGADCGVAFDADGDRCGFVDEKGVFIAADLIFLALAKDLLARRPGAKIIYDVKCTQLIADIIPRYGGIPLMHRTGHAPIKRSMREDRDIILAGELSGHFYFAEDYFRIDDGLWGAARVLEIFSRTPGAFSSLVADLPSRARTPDMKIPCPDERKFAVITGLTAALSKKYRASTVDGIRFAVSPTGWGVIRASNTSPYITVRIEGINAAEVDSIKNIIADAFKEFPEVARVQESLHIIPVKHPSPSPKYQSLKPKPQIKK